MDEDDPNEFDIYDVLDALDEMFVDGQVVMPDGSLLCLCGRDPGSDAVMTQIAKAAALSAEYGLFLNGCVKDAAVAYDRMQKDLKTGPARRLRRCMQNSRKIVEVSVLNDADDDGTAIIPGSRVPH